MALGVHGQRPMRNAKTRAVVTLGVVLGTWAVVACSSSAPDSDEFPASPDGVLHSNALDGGQSADGDANAADAADARTDADAADAADARTDADAADARTDGDAADAADARTDADAADAADAGDCRYATDALGRVCGHYCCQDLNDPTANTFRWGNTCNSHETGINVNDDYTCGTIGNHPPVVPDAGPIDAAADAADAADAGPPVCCLMAGGHLLMLLSSADVCRSTSTGVVTTRPANATCTGDPTCTAPPSWCGGAQDRPDLRTNPDPSSPTLIGCYSNWNACEREKQSLRDAQCCRAVSHGDDASCQHLGEIDNVLYYSGLPTCTTWVTGH